MNYELQVIIVEVARPKFIADADLRHSLVIGVRAREPMIDILTALEGGTLGLSDPEVLQVACRESRVLISHVGTQWLAIISASSDEVFAARG